MIYNDKIIYNGSKIIDIPDDIILALFRDKRFHRLNSKQGGEFYIDLLDESMTNDIEIDSLLDKRIDSIEDFTSEFANIANPYIIEIFEKLKELHEKNWIKLKNIKIEPLDKEKMPKTRVRDMIMPAGKVKTIIIKVLTERINWYKFINYVANISEMTRLDWDNIYNPQKQKRLLMQRISQKIASLEKNKNIILFPFDYANLKFAEFEDEEDARRILFLPTLQNLNRDGIILVNGISVYQDPFTGSFQIKANISVTDKFYDFIKDLTINDRGEGKEKELGKAILRNLEGRAEKANFKKEIIEEVNEKLEKQRKVFERLGKQISFLTPKNFNTYSQYLKQYEEVSKRISEEIAPIKNVLQKVDRLQLTAKNYLTPTLQRLAPSLKQLEEQIKNFNELYKAPDYSLSETIISPDLIRVRQGAEMISELREVRKLIEKSTTEKTKPMPITIVGDVGIKKSGEKDALPKFKNNIKLPPNTIWEDIEIKFQNEFDVEIYAKGNFLEKRNNVKMEFFKSGTKDKKPDIQWYFLYSLSAVQHLKKEEATIKKMADTLSHYLGDNKKITQDACMQIKSKLSKKLQEIFNINTEPFYDYEERGFYQTKFKLKPVPDLRGNGEPYLTGARYDDSKEYKKSGDDDIEDDLNSNY